MLLLFCVKGSKILNTNTTNELEISLPLRDQITDILRREIISGELKEGEKISERYISSRFNVSTAPAKEAIRTLNMEGLLCTYPRKGTFVSDLYGSNLVQMVHLRGVIEGTAAYWGTRNISDEDIVKMGKHLDTFRILLTQDVHDKEIADKIAKNNYTFHRILSINAGNPYLDQLILTLGSINNTIRYLYYFTDDVASDYCISYSEHSAIYEAVKARNCTLAEELTSRHIRRVADTVLKKTSPHSV